MPEHFRAETPRHILEIIDQVWEQKELFIRWPREALVLMPGTIREKYHAYPLAIKERLKAAGVPRDTRSNGPAVSAFLLAGGERPARTIARHSWSIHHIYDGQHPYQPHLQTIRAVIDGRYFTHTAGLVAAHPVVDALADEFPYFAWLLRQEAHIRFGFDPDGVFVAAR